MNNEAYVDSGERRLQATVPRDEYCSLCDRADDGASRQASGAWSAVMAPWEDTLERLHLRRDRTWHLAADSDAVEAVQLGSMFLTEWSWWIEQPRVRAEGSGDARGPICDACIRFVRARSTGQQDI